MRLAASVLAIVFALTASANAAEPDAVVHSTPETVVRGYIATDTPPVVHIKSGQSVRIETVSHVELVDDPVAYFGKVGIPADQLLKDAPAIQKLSKEKNLSGHVLTGPVYIEGAAPGDMLEVRILKIDIRVPYGVNNPSGTAVAADVIKGRDAKIIKLDLARKMAIFSNEIELPLAPFMGVMAVAPPPELKRVSSRPPGVFGGNMDFRRLNAGATLYLPVFNDGALFVTGDSHALQSDGEVDGTAIESSMAPTLQFIVHKGAGKAMKFPRAEDAANYYVMGMDEDLDLALKNAVLEAVEFLKARGLSETDAYSLSSVGVHFEIAEAVDKTLVVYGMIPKSIFKTKTAYWRP
jgi:acetamidase/formamidase